MATPRRAQPRYFTAAEVADALDVHVATVHRWVASGQLESSDEGIAADAVLRLQYPSYAATPDPSCCGLAVPRDHWERNKAATAELGG